MTSRERVRRAIRFEEPDRIPIDWGMITLSGIHERAYRNLLNYFGVDENITVSDPVQHLALPSEPILERFNADTRVIWANPPSHFTFERDKEGNFYDEFGVFYKTVGDYSDSRGYPLEKAETISDLRSYSLTDPEDPSRFYGLKEKAEELYSTTDKALVAGSFPALYYVAWILRGYENFMADIAFDESFANYLLDMIVDWWIAFLEKYLEAVGPYVEIMWAGDDWGTQTGPLISPEEFRKNVVPRFKKVIEFMKTGSDAKLAYHCCGAVQWALDDFVEMGVDILHPVQANAVGNEDAKLIKEKTHGRLVIHGGLDNQGTFHLDSDTVRNSAREKVTAFKPGGGYLFSSGHNIQGNCPPENIVTLFEVAEELRDY